MSTESHCTASSDNEKERVILGMYQESFAIAARAFEMHQSKHSYAKIADACGLQVTEIKRVIERYRNSLSECQRYAETAIYSRLAIEYFPLPDHVKNKLYFENISMVGDLANRVKEQGWDALSAIKNIGAASMDTIKSVMPSFVDKALGEQLHQETHIRHIKR